MTITYVLGLGHNDHPVRRIISGDVVNDTSSHLIIRPHGGRMTVAILKSTITKVEVN